MSFRLFHQNIASFRNFFELNILLYSIIVSQLRRHEYLEFFRKREKEKKFIIDRNFIR